jgi:UDP-N-acetylglucosamine:LPS N-acetylglucosamine transferase
LQEFRHDVAAKKLQLFGFTKNMKKLYQQANVVITKAGGLGLTEAAIYGCPIIVTSALPGHEENNLAVFFDAMAIWYATNTQQIISTIKDIMKDTNITELKVSQASRLVSHLATKHISESLVTRLK